MVKGEMGLTADRREEDRENAEDGISARWAHFGGYVVLYGFLCWYLTSMKVPGGEKLTTRLMDDVISSLDF
jgi:hypothetical protein